MRRSRERSVAPTATSPSSGGVRDATFDPALRGARLREVDVGGGWRCSEHRRIPWDRWRADQPPEKSSGYGSRWRKFKAAIVAERGPVCEYCGADGVPLSLHHLDHRPPSSPRGFDPSNVKLACTSCHVRESRRRVA